MNSAPTGTITFLFTDIEGSTRRWEEHSQQMRAALARHDEILRRAIESNDGYVFKTVGDAFYSAFASPLNALHAALDAQHMISAERWEDEIGSLKVRMALHTGVVEGRDGDYFGQPLNRVARLLSSGHGGQVLLSLASQELVRDGMPLKTSLLDLGEHRLKDLIRPERIFQLLAPGLNVDFPPLKTLDTRPNNLPRQTTPLIGREKELETVLAMLRNRDVALVTLTGPGGTGKTRLGLQVAAELIDDFQAGAFFVNLAPTTDASLVASAVAQALGVQESAGKSLVEGLKEHLRNKEILLLLDNFEQVIQAASLVSELLSAAPGLKVLVTSREVLHIRGEHDYPVPPLGLPPVDAHGKMGRVPLDRLSQYEAVRLFIERAQAAKPDFEINNDNAAAVAEICYRLDGLPLAIELAAARVKILSPQAMMARLQNRLKVLLGGARDMPARQQTLRDTIDWSYSLLNEDEAKLFRRLAVFVGGRSLEAIEAVCGATDDSFEASASESGPVPSIEPLGIDILEGVASLVDKSLLRQEGASQEPRFVMLETIHEYAHEKLEESGEGEAMRRRHLAYFLQMAEEIEPKLTGPEQVSWLARLEEEHDNMRAALSFTLQNTAVAAEGLRLAGSLWRFWFMHTHLTEAAKWFHDVLEATTSLPPALRSKATYGASVIATYQGDWELGTPLQQQALALFEMAGDKQGMGWVLNDMVFPLLVSGDFELAEEYLERSLAYKIDVGDLRDIAIAWDNIANLARIRGDYERAVDLAERSISVHRQGGDKYGLSVSLGDLGYTLYHKGDAQRAVTLFKEAIVVGMEIGIVAHVAGSLAGLGGAIGALGDPLRAATLLGAADGILASALAAYNPSDQVGFESIIAAVRSQLDDEAWQAALAEGQAMTLEQAVNYALGQ